MTSHLRLSFAAGLIALASLASACTTEEEEAPPVKHGPSVAYLSPVEHLSRISMALRGQRPSIDDIARVQKDPKVIPAIVDEYLASPAFGKVIRDLHSEAFLTRVDYFYYPAGFQPLGPLASEDIYRLNHSIEEVSARIAEHVVTNDRPYSEIVTADYIMANDVVAKVWGNLDVTGTDWQEAHWKDKRPKAGVLSDPWLFTRYQSTPSNRGRGRANAVSKSLLCYDFLSRDIEIDASINLADPAVVDNAVVKNPACASCHQVLDPLAAYFQDYFPLTVPANFTTYPFRLNNPNGNGGTFDFYTKGLGVYYYGKLREPSYFGQEGKTIEDLGQNIAADPRFSLCAVDRFYSYFHQTSIDSVDLDVAAHFQKQFLDSGMNVKSLIRAIVLDDEFRLSYTADKEEAKTLVGVLKTSPDQLGSMIEELTGFRWIVDPSLKIGKVDLLEDSFLGFQVLGGGVDGAFVTRPANTFNATTSLLLETVGAQSSAFVVRNDSAIDDASKRKLFGLVNPKGGEDSDVRAQLAYLHARLYAETVATDSPEVNATFELFSQLRDHANGDSARAWQGTLTAMLQDIRVATY
jgi:hypothetical protein